MQTGQIKIGKTTSIVLYRRHCNVSKPVANWGSMALIGQTDSGANFRSHWLIWTHFVGTFLSWKMVRSKNQGAGFLQRVGKEIFFKIDTVPEMTAIIMSLSAAVWLQRWGKLGVFLKSPDNIWRAVPQLSACRSWGADLQAWWNKHKWIWATRDKLLNPRV